MNNSSYYNEESIEFNNPRSILIDKEEESENVNHYREASRRFISVLSLTLSFIQQHKNPQLAILGVGYALGIECITEGKSQREIAREIGVSHYTISWTAKEFKKYANLNDI